MPWFRLATVDSIRDCRPFEHGSRTQHIYIINLGGDNCTTLADRCDTSTAMQPPNDLLYYERLSLAMSV